MKRTDFYQLIVPLMDRLYVLAHTLLPDDLHAEQLVIDSVNAYLLKERKSIWKAEVDMSNKKDLLLVRKKTLKGIIRHLGEIGGRRSLQLTEQMRLTIPNEHKSFYALDPKIRLILRLRYEGQFSVDEICDIFGMPRYEVIEKLHNGRFLLINEGSI
jgi:hypothetical protein